MSKTDKEKTPITAEELTPDNTSTATTPTDNPTLAGSEDHVAVDDVDAAKMFRETIVNDVKEEERPLSTTATLRTILGGDILNAQLIRRQVWLMLLIVFFIIIYVSNRYSCQKDLLEIDNLNEQLKDAKYKALSSNSIITEKCRESNVLEVLRNNADSTLHMPTQPPYIIQVPEK